MWPSLSSPPPALLSPPPAQYQPSITTSRQWNPDGQGHGSQNEEKKRQNNDLVLANFRSHVVFFPFEHTRNKLHACAIHTQNSAAWQLSDFEHVQEENIIRKTFCRRAENFCCFVYCSKKLASANFVMWLKKKSSPFLLYWQVRNGEQNEGKPDGS